MEYLSAQPNCLEETLFDLFRCLQVMAVCARVPALVNCLPCCSGPCLMWLFSSHFCSCYIICRPHGHELQAQQLLNSQAFHMECLGDVCFFKDHCFLPAFEGYSGSNKKCDLLGTVIHPPCFPVIEETLTVTGLESC